MERAYPSCFMRQLGVDNVKQVQIGRFMVARPNEEICRSLIIASEGGGSLHAIFCSILCHIHCSLSIDSG